MYDHIGLQVKDVDASVAFYESVLKPLGMGVCSHDASSASFGPDGAAVLYLSGGGGKGPGTHVAWTAPSREAVDLFHAAGLKAGGRDNGGPGVRADYSPSYYAAFLIDPDGNNVEAVCMT